MRDGKGTTAIGNSRDLEQIRYLRSDWRLVFRPSGLTELNQYEPPSFYGGPYPPLSGTEIRVWIQRDPDYLKRMECTEYDETWEKEKSDPWQ